jgi:Flp pilus assembly protein TadD
MGGQVGWRNHLIVICGCWSWIAAAELSATEPRARRPAAPRVRSADTLADASALPPKQGAQACKSTAETLVRHGHPTAAIGLFERARQLDGKRVRVARELAVLYDQAGADQRAIEEYQRALQQTPKDPDLLNDLGYFYLTRGDAIRAEKWFRAALAQDPGHTTANGNLALAVGEQGRYEEAFETFSSVTGPAAAHSNLGIIFLRHGDFDQAQRALRQALRLDSSLKPARAALAYLEEQQESAAGSPAVPQNAAPAN